MPRTTIRSEDITDAQVKCSDVATGIDAVKLADGTVTDAELQYINTLSSNAQTQITNVKTTADAASTKGFAIAMGVALG